MNTIFLQIKAKHFFGAEYVQNCNCPVANAAKEHFGTFDVSEQVDCLVVNGTIYTHKSYPYASYLEDEELATSQEGSRNGNKVIRTIVLTRKA